MTASELARLSTTVLTCLRIPSGWGCGKKKRRVILVFALCTPSLCSTFLSNDVIITTPSHLVHVCCWWWSRTTCVWYRITCSMIGRASPGLVPWPCTNTNSRYTHGVWHTTSSSTTGSLVYRSPLVPCTQCIQSHFLSSNKGATNDDGFNLQSLPKRTKFIIRDAPNLKRGRLVPWWMQHATRSVYR